jgi:hypothetical protein
MGLFTRSLHRTEYPVSAEPGNAFCCAILHFDRATAETLGEGILMVRTVRALAWAGKQNAIRLS